MMRPMPFCPPFNLCANDTPVQVRISSMMSPVASVGRPALLMSPTSPCAG